MNGRVIEDRLRSAAGRWRRRLLLQRTVLLASIWVGGFLLLGVFVWREWLSEPALFAGFVVIGTIALALAWLVMAFITMLRYEPNWLARRLEEADPKLQDRLNTWIHLAPGGRLPAEAGREFLEPLAGQTAEILKSGSVKIRLPARPLVRQLSVFAVLAAGMAWFYAHFHPLAGLGTRAEDDAIEPESAVAPPALVDVADIAEPVAPVEEAEDEWGEILITEPGRDIQATKVDVVPIRIEAASNNTLTSLGWRSAVNGAEEVAHPLPEPAEPRFAAGSDTIYLDEFDLSDWDVVTYFAEAGTRAGTNYVSEVYFLEVRPFREDILKMPGGESGQAYSVLSRLTGLIDRQRHVIRETHRHLEAPPSDPRQLQEDRGKLAAAEADLAESTRHLYSEMSRTMENMPIGPAQDALAKAADLLEEAGRGLEENAVDEVPGLEREALSELVSARKIFHRAVSENPEAFEDGSAEEPAPIASTENALEEIAEFRDEDRAVQEALGQAAAQQRAIADQAAENNPRNRLTLGGRQDEVRQRLEQLRNDHPRAFEGLEEQADEASEAVQRSAEAMAGSPEEAAAPAGEAAGKLERLRDAQEKKAGDRQLADAYQLKKILDEQIASLEQCQATPGSFSQGDLQSAASQSRSALEQLKEIVDSPSAGGSFGRPIKGALADSRMEFMNHVLDVLGESGTDAAKRTMAANAARTLSEVTSAFEQSVPELLQEARQNDPLQPSTQDGMQRGISQLESLARRMENGSPMPRGARGSQAREALANLQAAMASGSSDGADDPGSPAAAILEDLEDRVGQGEDTIDLEFLEGLISRLRNISVELAGTDDDEEPADMSHVDPARIPPEYRGRIQRYFQKLSEE